MLAIGRILRTGARLLLLDEPTEGLAPSSSSRSADHRRLKQQGFTILLVEQNFRFASTVADRYYVMEHGASSTGSPMPSSTPIWTSCTTISGGTVTVAWVSRKSADTIKGERYETGDQLASVAALAAARPRAAQAQYSDGVIKIGVLNDMSGIYADLSGPARWWRRGWRSRISAAAAKGMKVEIVVADHQNKPDVGSNIARTGSTSTRST